MERNASERFNSNSGRNPRPPQSTSGLKRPTPHHTAYPGMGGPPSKQTTRQGSLQRAG